MHIKHALIKRGGVLSAPYGPLLKKLNIFDRKSTSNSKSPLVAAFLAWCIVYFVLKINITAILIAPAQKEASELKMIKFFGLLCLVGLASACCMVSKWEAFEGFTVGASKEGQGSYTEVRTRASCVSFVYIINTLGICTNYFVFSVNSFMCLHGQTVQTHRI